MNTQTDRDMRGFQVKNLRAHNITAYTDFAQTVAGMFGYETATKRLAFYDTANPSTLTFVPRMDQANTWSATQTFSVPAAFTQSTGTAPFTVSSTTVVTNLNADLLDGYNSDSAANANTIALRDSAGRLAAADPSTSSHLVTLGFLQSYYQGVRDPKNACRAATTTNLSATRSSNVLTASSNGALTVDGVTMANGDRLLVKNQSTAADNGIYDVTDKGSGSTPFVLTRSTDADESTEVTNGMYTVITSGTTQTGSEWLLTTADTITLNTTNLTFAQVGAGANLTAGNGIDITGNTVSVKINASTTYVANSVVYSDTTSTLNLVSVNSSGTNKFLRQVSSGTPSFQQVATSDLSGASALTKTDDTNVTLTLGGTPTTCLLTAASITVGWSGQLGLTRGGTNASLTADNGAIVYSTSSALALLASTATANKVLMSGSSAAPSWSSATYPASTTVNQLLYSSSANTVVGLATANRAVLTTTSGGVPQLTALTDGQLIIGSTSGAPSAAGLTGTSNQISVATGSNSITLSTPQNIDTGATVTFAKGIFSGLTITTDADGTIGTVDGTVTISKNTTNTRTFYGLKQVATVTPGASNTTTTINNVSSVATLNPTNGNASTTLNMFFCDTTNTQTYGMTVNLLNLKYGGSAAFVVSSAGAVTTGVWNGTVVTVTYGGTGASTLASNGVLYGNGTSAVQALAVNSLATNKFLTQSSSGAPAWATIQSSDLTTACVTSITGTANQVIASGSTGAVTLSTPQDIATSSTVTFKTLTLTHGTITSAAPTLNATVTWNSGGTTFTGWKYNVTNSASASDSKLLDIQVGGTSYLSYGIDGRLSVGPTNSVLTILAYESGSTVAGMGITSNVLEVGGYGSSGGVNLGYYTDKTTFTVWMQLAASVATLNIPLTLTALTTASFNSLGTTQDDTKGIVLSNTTAAANAAQQISPAIRWKGYGWKTNSTAASQEIDFRAFAVPVQGTANPTATWRLEFSVNGGSYSTAFEVTSAGVITTGSIAASSVTSGAALTKTDDTNVTLTLGGTPTTALLAATSLTLGWTGQLGVTRGGTGLSSCSQGDLFYGSASNTILALPKNTSSNYYLKNSGTSNNPQWAAITASDVTSGANLTASTGLSITAGSGTAALLVAATLAIDQTFAPTWTGVHTFSVTARSSGSAAYMTINAPADTALTASTEAIGINFVGATRQHATGSLTTQREYVFGQPTYSFVGASTLTRAATIAVVGPTAGTNATLSNSCAIWIQNTSVTASSVIGGYINPSGNASGSVYGFDIEADCTYSGTTAAVDCIRARVTNGAANTVTAGASFHARSPSISGTGTSIYGLYIDQMKASNVTTGWGVYQSDTGDLNVFAGKTFFGGTTSPTALNHYACNSTTVPIMQFTASSAALLTARVQGALENDSNALLYYTPNTSLSNALDRKRIALSHSVDMTSGQPGVAGTGTTSITVDHYLGTQDVQVSIYALTTNNGNAVGDKVDLDVNVTSTSRVTISGVSAIASADYRVVITG